jgi:anti-sigma-K factor RskA
MMDERLQENACLYAADAMSPQENRAFEQELHGNAELQNLVRELRDAASGFALAEKTVAPPLRLKAKILAQIEGEQKRTEDFSLLTLVNQLRSAWLPWAVAGGFAVLVAVQFVQAQALRQQTNAQAFEAEGLRKQTADLNSAVTNLSSQIAALEKKDEFSRMRIAMLSSLLDNSPKALAVSLWDNDKQNGVLVVQNLAPAPTDKDYQLWVINDKYPAPVNAGVFSVDEKGNVRFTFKPDMPMTSVDKFAVTVERKGGVPKAEGKVALVGG